MSPTESCGSCRFWRDQEREVHWRSSSGRDFIQSPYHEGQCRVRAPQPGTAWETTLWPMTRRDEWCGEYESTHPAQPSAGEVQP